MNGPCGRNGLMLAGLIVTLVGLAVVTASALEIRGPWTTVFVGLVLLSIGWARRAFGGRDDTKPPGTR